MRRAPKMVLNLFAFSLLAFAIYLNFFYKEEEPGFLKSPPTVVPKEPATDVSVKAPAVKK